MFNIIDYGAQPEKIDYCANAMAIQRAIDEASNIGGGVVVIPKGTFYSACLFLKSNVTLYLELGAKLVASSHFSDYAPSKQNSPWAPMPGIPLLAADKLYAFICAEHAENISICGEGEINGQGMNKEYFPSLSDPLGRRPHLLLFHHCKNVSVSGITLSDPAFFTCFLVMCQNATIKKITIDSMNTENGDGIDLDGCTNVDIIQCMIRSGDDAVSLKTTDPTWKCDSIRIRECVFTTVWGGVRLGTESTADIRNVCVEKCVFWNCNDAIKIQDCSYGQFESISFSDCVMFDVHRPFFITLSRFRLSKKDNSIRPYLGGIRNISISNISAHVCSNGEQSERNCMVISGCQEAKIENIIIDNVEIVLHEKHNEEGLGRIYVPEYLDYSFLYADIFSINGWLPCCGPFLRHINGITFRRFRIIQSAEDPRPAFFGYDVKKAEFIDVSVSDNIAEFIQGTDMNASFDGCFVGKRSVVENASLNDKQTMQYEKLCRESLLVNQLFDDYAIMIDEAQSFPNCKTIHENEWMQSENALSVDVCGVSASKCIITIPIFGSVRLYCNGLLVGACKLPEEYRGLILWPCDITDYQNGGKFEIKLEWDDPTEQGGVECVLPFGAFSKFSCGVYGTTTVYWRVGGHG